MPPRQQQNQHLLISSHKTGANIMASYWLLAKKKILRKKMFKVGVSSVLLLGKITHMN